MFKENKINVARIYSLTNKRKKRIFATIQHIKDQIFNIDYLKEFLRSSNNLDNLEITKLLNIENLDEYRKCLFIKNQFAWISENQNKKQRYFTKGNIIYGLDVYDLLSIYFNCTYSQIFYYLAEMGYSLTDKLKHKNHYENNINEIMNIIQTNKDLKILISDKIDIYIAMNEFAKTHSLTFDKYKNEEIFFISTRFLKEKYSLEYSISTINQMINLYALIGLIYKVPELTNDINKAYQSNSKKAPINFYAIPKIKEVLNIIKRNSFIINHKNLNYHNLNKNNLILLQELNYEISCSINKGGGDKTKKAKQLILDKDNMEMLFLSYLNKYGVVAKEWIKEEKKITLKNTSFDKKWRELTSKNNGKTIKPNKLLKEKYSLTTNQDIFILNK